MHQARPSTTLYYKACTKHVLVLLCTTKLAQSTSQYYFVLQSLHKARPSTTLYYKPYTKLFPQYYFVLQSLHQALPSTTLYVKACTKHFPILLCTTKLAQSTSQYYSVRQSLHKALSNTTLHYKARKKDFPVLPCTTSQYYCVHSLQCVLQHHMANPHVPTHMATHYTAICKQRFNKRIEVRTREQPHVPEQQGRTDSTSKRPQPQPPHSGLCTEKHKVSCSGLLPKTSPMQHSCSHYNAYCSITWPTRMSLRTWQQNVTTIMQPTSQSPLPFPRTTSLGHHFLGHHFPKSPLPQVNTPASHHFPSLRSTLP